MTNIQGTYSGKLQSQTTIPVPDRADHQIGVVVISGLHKSADDKWNGAKMTYWGTADTVGGNGEQRGYFRNEHAHGDTSHGIFEARVTTSGTGVTLEGTWRFAGGTGGFAMLSGDGVFKAQLASPTDVEMTWSGRYELG